MLVVVLNHGNLTCIMMMCLMTMVVDVHVVVMMCLTIMMVMLVDARS